MLIPSEQRTERVSLVGCAGSARYSADECREQRNESGTAEVAAFVSCKRGKGCFSYVYQMEVNSNGL